MNVIYNKMIFPFNHFNIIITKLLFIHIKNYVSNKNNSAIEMENIIFICFMENDYTFLVYTFTIIIDNIRIYRNKRW